MEKLLLHYAGNISLEPDSLRALAEAVDKHETCVPPARADAESIGSEYLGVDHEKFTVQPLANNITRKNENHYMEIQL
jgi:hypothetical protein